MKLQHILAVIFTAGSFIASAQSVTPENGALLNYQEY